MNDFYEMMICSGALKIDTNKYFTFSSGIISPIYCDTRKLISFPEYRKKTILNLFEMTKLIPDIECIAGVATGGIPWGAWLADRLDIPFCYVRSEKKSYGPKNTIEGVIPNNSNILILEDVVTTGNSLGRVASHIMELGEKNISAICLFSYNFKESKELLSGLKINLYPLMELNDLITQIPDNDQREDIKKWSKNPWGWTNAYKR